jgi:hypothetical protein
MGGSAALGANQISEYRGLFAYPRGLYTWPDSIAGQLEAYLETKRPGTDFEVITAAAVTRAYHPRAAGFCPRIRDRRLHPRAVPRAQAGYRYVDMNRTLTTVPGSVEFFTDYCHTTKEGNRRIAARALQLPGLWKSPGQAGRWRLPNHPETRILPPPCSAGAERSGTPA